MQAEEVISRLKTLANPANVKGMARFGINSHNTLGIPLRTLRPMAREIGKDHVLAQQLWDSGIHEARILASIIGKPAQVTKEQMEAWVEDLDSWDVCDQVCMNLWGKSPHAYRKPMSGALGKKSSRNAPPSHSWSPLPSTTRRPATSDSRSSCLSSWLRLRITVTLCAKPSTGRCGR